MEKGPSVMVCVTTQRACERLIKAGAAAAEPSAAPLHVVHVASGKQRFFNSENEGEALEYLFDVSKGFGADMAVIRSDDVVGTLTAFAREKNVRLIIFGQSNELEGPNSIIRRVEADLDGTGVSIAIQRRIEERRAGYRSAFAE